MRRCCRSYMIYITCHVKPYKITIFQIRFKSLFQIRCWVNQTNIILFWNFEPSWHLNMCCFILENLMQELSFFWSFCKVVFPIPLRPLICTMLFGDKEISISLNNSFPPLLKDRLLARSIRRSLIFLSYWYNKKTGWICLF